MKKKKKRRKKKISSRVIDTYRAFLVIPSLLYRLKILFLKFFLFGENNIMFINQGEILLKRTKEKERKFSRLFVKWRSTRFIDLSPLFERSIAALRYGFQPLPRFRPYIAVSFSPDLDSPISERFLILLIRESSFPLSFSIRDIRYQHFSPNFSPRRKETLVFQSFPLSNAKGMIF